MLQENPKSSQNILDDKVTMDVVNSAALYQRIAVGLVIHSSQRTGSQTPKTLPGEILFYSVWQCEIAWCDCSRNDWCKANEAKILVWYHL